jgi:endonuclease/exonuclease/phosphatase family metal-dependent hydrolase
MRIVSLNAWGGARFDELVDWMPRCGADVVCLQEVTRTAATKGWTRFDDGERSLPQRANLFDDVRAALPQHQAQFLACDAGPVRDDEGRRRRQDFGVAMLVEERLPVVGSDSSFIHGTFVDHDEWPGSDRPRLAQAARLVDRERDRVVTVIHLHGLRDGHGKRDNEARRQQADRIATLVARIRHRDDLTVVCGDFNLLPDSETFRVLGSLGLVDLVRETPTRTALYDGDVRHADYLLVSDPAAVEDFRVVTHPIVSDHCALLLDL